MTDIESNKRDNKQSKLHWAVFFDAFAVTIVIVFNAISEFGWMDGWLVKKGFYCDDRTIQRPYTGDTISTGLLIISGLIPMGLIWLTEALFYYPSTLESSNNDEARTRYSQAWSQTWYLFKKYGKGLLIKLLIVVILKMLAGEHRPHFLDTCKPNIICQGNEYVSTYICTNTEEKQYFIRDASKSFPSGHSSTSIYEAIFMIWYLQKRVPKLRSAMALIVCQLAIGVWGIVCPLSRIIDNRHHWWDVLAGSIIGLIAAFLVCYVSCKNFEPVKPISRNQINKDYDLRLIGCGNNFKQSNKLPNTMNGY